MRRRTTHAILSIACMAAAAVAFAGTPVERAAPEAERTADAMQDAAGAAVVATLRNQFQGRDVEFKLAGMHASRASLRDVALEGEGRIRIDGAGGWLPVHFEALYDTATGVVLSPAITLDRNPSASPVTPTEGLDRAVASALDREFSSQDVAFELDSAWRTGGGERFAVIDGQGVARFEGEGEAEVRLQAVYDLVAERWIHVGYALGGEPAPTAPAFAAR
ncbi:MAG TPA: hypothetical protein VFM73_09040 [Xanthomonadaceae bacterium]|nr:hypothetical protein [Xanthomonadaceae bacterium]